MLWIADPAYKKGATDFVRVVSAALGDTNLIICPCVDCRNLARHLGSTIVDHLVMKGMDEAYKIRTDWFYHEVINSAAEDERKEKQWNDEVFELYEAAACLDQDFVSKGDWDEIDEDDDGKKGDDFLERLADAE